VDERFTRTTASKSDNYMTDALGSTLALTDATGAINTQYSHEAYGNTTQSGIVSDNAYQYTGRENDGTGLYYYRARYYDTQTSRFISQDPIGFGGGVNQFAYVEGNPIGKVDPSGLKPVEDYLNDWVCGSKGWGDALDTARKQKMGDFDPSDPMDADNRTAAEHYIFGRYLKNGDAGIATAAAYVVSGGYWGFGYQGAKMAGLFPHASPPSYAQLYWEEKAYTDAIGLTGTFSGSPGKCGCGEGK
jgi:RHS repeat-associated protein